MKAVVFEGVTYRVPEWVNWMARDQDGEICGYEIEPNIRFDYFAVNGERMVVIRSPETDESWRNSAARV